MDEMSAAKLQRVDQQREKSRPCGCLMNDRPQVIPRAGPFRPAGISQVGYAVSRYKRGLTRRAEVASDSLEIFEHPRVNSASSETARQLLQR
jgi:hypothetical protein